jgi:hypothetical protein
MQNSYICSTITSHSAFLNVKAASLASFLPLQSSSLFQLIFVIDIFLPFAVIFKCFLYTLWFEVLLFLLSHDLCSKLDGAFL